MAITFWGIDIWVSPEAQDALCTTPVRPIPRAIPVLLHPAKQLAARPRSRNVLHLRTLRQRAHAQLNSIFSSLLSARTLVFGRY